MKIEIKTDKDPIYYTGKIIFEDAHFIRVETIKGEIIRINKSDIRRIFEKDGDGYNGNGKN